MSARVTVLERSRVFLWPHRLFFLGYGLEADLHRHHAAQFCFSATGTLRVRTAAWGQWLRARGFLVAPDRSHQFESGEGLSALLLVDPETDEFAEAASLHPGAGPIVPLEPDPDALVELDRLLVVEDREHANTIARRLMGLDDDVDGVRPVDSRVRRAQHWLRDHLADRIRMTEVAEAAGVSESHLAHLFRAETGVPVRRFVLWLRLRRVIELALRGHSLTEAAHEAGFADSAHMSRTFRDTFGLPPSFLSTGTRELDAVFCDGVDEAQPRSA